MFRAFGLPGLLGSVLGQHAGTVTLTKITAGNRTPTNLPGGTNPSSRNYTGRGYVADYSTSQIDGTQIVRGDKMLVIYASTIGAAPEPGDRVRVDGTLYAVIGVDDLDPAGARYVCQVRA